MIKTDFTLPAEMADKLILLAKAAIRPRKPTFISYSLRWPAVSPLTFLRRAENTPRVYWESTNSPVAIAGYDAAAMLMADGEGRFEDIRKQSWDLFRNIICLNDKTPDKVGPRLFGGFSFQVEDKPQALWSAFPAARFVLPRIQLMQFADDETWLTVNQPLGPKDNPEEVAWQMHEEIRRMLVIANLEQGEVAKVTSKQVHRSFDDIMTPETWNRLVSRITCLIRRGDLEKVVLARARRMRSKEPIDPIDVMIRLKQNYPDCYRFLFEPVPGHAFYGASPELLAEVTKSELRTAALAGSIRRGETPEEDDALGQELMTNPKERHEQALVVDVMEEKLRPIMTRLEIAPEPNLLKLSNIQHLQTAITGRIKRSKGILPVIEALHPTPALGGRPRDVALSIINEAEPVSRGWYGSPIGWIDPRQNGIFAVAIRSALSVNRETMLYAGAGIVADSVPKKEWRETQLKFKALTDALGGLIRE
ncbi:MAG: isochorismate synthase [Anaerolineae bacterium]|nr:isochorismate synthase [Anaerolineae bacterium]